MEKMKALLEKIAKDSMLQEKFNAVMRDAENQEAAAAAEKLGTLIKDAGIDVTLEELLRFAETEDDAGEELGNGRLDLVSGGMELSGGMSPLAIELMLRPQIRVLTNQLIQQSQDAVISLYRG
jgi:hypothetical protein